MNIIKRKRNLFYGLLGLSLAVLMVSALYLEEIKKQESAENVFQSREVLSLPVVSVQEQVIELPMRVNANLLVGYFDSSKSEDELMKAVTEFEGVWRPSQSVCYGFSNKVFEITAMISGKVTDIYQDELMGKCVEVDSGQGLVITYQSLSQTNVVLNQEVAQFDLIGLAGENSYHSDLGVHAQITAHLNGRLIDPESLIECKISDLD